MIHPKHWLCGLALASLTLTSSPASAGELEPLGDTALEPLDRDELVATSTSYQPGVRHGGGAIRVGFEPADPALVGPPLLELATAVSVGVTPGLFTLTFNGDTTASHFDGRLLTARDLTRDQGYRMEATSTFAIAHTFELFRGGVRLAVADVDDGVAPFVLEGVDQDELVHRVDARPDGHGGGHIELDSWSLGTWNATFDDGATLVVDRVVVRAHELGHLITVRHESTAQVIGAKELRVGVEDLIVPDDGVITARVADAGGGAAAIDMSTPTTAATDVRSVFVLAASAAAPRKTLFTPPTGYRIRLRSGRDGAKLGAWSAWSTSATLVTPAPAADQAIDDFEIEIQRAGGPTIATHGYIKIKKLNSGG
ncbi:MAG: hypothetical protein F9K40_16370 [Kofleriaceae bacterium]|nr:MAG: hypothetical protein F9K40_16370 [Kofleriaceae bacterium]MBZ0236782.1 hypothetical protein [Kofleriaceae bacterium]